MQYFKTKKKEKCLATLDLLRVGTIEMDPSDASGCTFTIEVAGRPYYLCADTKEKATDWCINLNRSKEARANLGGESRVESLSMNLSWRKWCFCIRYFVCGYVVRTTDSFLHFH